MSKRDHWPLFGSKRSVNPLSFLPWIFLFFLSFSVSNLNVVMSNNCGRAEIKVRPFIFSNNILGQGQPAHVLVLDSHISNIVGKTNEKKVDCWLNFRAIIARKKSYAIKSNILRQPRNCKKKTCGRKKSHIFF